MNWMLVVDWLEMIGGSRPLPETSRLGVLIAVSRAVWWVFLLLVAIAFAGRNTKFVYVDF